MPLPDVLFPGDLGVADRARGEPLPGRLDPVGMLGMPALEQGAAGGQSIPRQLIQLGGGGAGRLLQEHVLAPRQRQARGLEVDLGRAADGHRIDLDRTVQQGGEGGEIGDPVDLGVAAGAGDQLEVRARGQAGNVLVAGDLANADDGHAKRVQSRLRSRLMAVA